MSLIGWRDWEISWIWWALKCRSWSVFNAGRANPLNEVWVALYSSSSKSNRYAPNCLPRYYRTGPGSTGQQFVFEVPPQQGQPLVLPHGAGSTVHPVLPGGPGSSEPLQNQKPTTAVGAQHCRQLNRGTTGWRPVVLTVEYYRKGPVVLKNTSAKHQYRKYKLLDPCGTTGLCKAVVPGGVR